METAIGYVRAKGFLNDVDLMKYGIRAFLNDTPTAITFMCSASHCSAAHSAGDERRPERGN